MNKYQEALNRIAYNYGLSALDGDTNKAMDEKFNEDMKVLKELVDKATPKKVVDKVDRFDYSGDYSHSSADCPCCGSGLVADDCDDFAYCPKCGQALGWDGEEG